MKLLTNDARKALVLEIIENPKFGFKKNANGEFAGLSQEQAAGIVLRILVEEIFTEADATQKKETFAALLAGNNVSALRQEFEKTEFKGKKLLGTSEGGRRGLDAQQLADKWGE